jgi:hypothetical protein
MTGFYTFSKEMERVLLQQGMGPPLPYGHLLTTIS